MFAYVRLCSLYGEKIVEGTAAASSGQSGLIKPKNSEDKLYFGENAAGGCRVELFKLAVAFDGSFSSASRRTMKKRFVVFGILLSVALRPWPGSGKEREWHAENGFRWAELEIPKTGKTGFTLLPPDQTGIYFTNTLSAWEGAANRVLYNGSGVAVGDYDHDGLPDIFLCGLETRNALYKNLGNWKFKDVTEEAGLVCPGKYFRGAVFADINGDGFLDLLVATAGRGVLCFCNDTHGKFKDIT